jgi:hypothetical protein
VAGCGRVLRFVSAGAGALGTKSDDDRVARSPGTCLLRLLCWVAQATDCSCGRRILDVEVELTLTIEPLERVHSTVLELQPRAHGQRPSQVGDEISSLAATP